MIPIKTSEEIEIMRVGGKILSQVLKEVAWQVKPGISTLELNQKAETLIKRFGVEAAFKGYRAKTNQPAYPFSLCTSVNNELVHGVPSSRILKEGDIIGLDLGIKYQNFYLDAALTVPVGRISREAKKLIEVTKKSLDLAIKKIKAGIFLAEISKTIQDYVEKNGFSVVRQLTGHGIGRELHEEPAIYDFVLPEWQKDFRRSPQLLTGMCLAIEPMVTAGGWQVKTLDDGWTVATVDNSLAAHFEKTVVVKKNGAEILTPHLS